MGEVSKFMVQIIVGHAMVDAMNELMSAAQSFSNVASILIEEELDYVNVNQVIEAAARCIDTIEVAVMSAVPAEGDSDMMAQFERSGLKKELDNTRETLDALRAQILSLAKDKEGD